MDTIDKNIESAKTIHSDFYISNDMFQISKEKIFARSWQILSDDKQLKLNGSAVPIQFIDGFIDEPLVLVNNHNNINCFSNVCTHRGNTIYSDTNISFTVTDMSGNQSTCSVSLIILDTVRPSIICPPNQLVFLDTTCVYLMEDYSHLSVVSDNCDTTFNFTHSISVGSPINRDTSIVLTFSDLSSYHRSFVFSVQVFDTHFHL